MTYQKFPLAYQVGSLALLAVFCLGYQPAHTQLAAPPQPVPVTWTDLPRHEMERLLPGAVHWATEQELLVLRTGVPLSPAQAADARAVGVQHPERVRLLRVKQINPPADPQLAVLAQGFISSNTIGLTIRYGIMLHEDAWTDRETLVHELTHTRQYEQGGSLETILRQYLASCLTPPHYEQSPFEVEARQCARRLVGDSAQ